MLKFAQQWIGHRNSSSSSPYRASEQETFFQEDEKSEGTYRSGGERLPVPLVFVEDPKGNMHQLYPTPPPSPSDLKTHPEVFESGKHHEVCLPNNKCREINTSSSSEESSSAASSTCTSTDPAHDSSDEFEVNTQGSWININCGKHEEIITDGVKPIEDENNNIPVNKKAVMVHDDYQETPSKWSALLSRRVLKFSSEQSQRNDSNISRVETTPCKSDDGIPEEQTPVSNWSTILNKKLNWSTEKTQTADEKREVESAVGETPSEVAQEQPGTPSTGRWADIISKKVMTISSFFRKSPAGEDNAEEDIAGKEEVECDKFHELNNNDEKAEESIDVEIANHIDRFMTITDFDSPALDEEIELEESRSKSVPASYRFGLRRSNAGSKINSPRLRCRASCPNSETSLEMQTCTSGSVKMSITDFSSAMSSDTEPNASESEGNITGSVAIVRQPSVSVLPAVDTHGQVNDLESDPEVKVEDASAGPRICFCCMSRTQPVPRDSEGSPV